MIYFLIILLLIFLDLFSKNYINKNYKLNEKKQIYKNLYIYHIKNEGMAYGIFKNFKNIIYVLICINLIFVIFMFYGTFKQNSKLKKLAFSFILAGALGNFIDRVKNKNVTDFIFIKFKKLPIFNLADIFLFISPIILIIKEIKDKNIQ